MMLILKETISSEPLLAVFEGMMLLTIFILLIRGRVTEMDSERSFQVGFISFCGRMAAIVPLLVIGGRMVDDAVHYYKLGSSKIYPWSLSSLDFISLGTPILCGIGIYLFSAIFKFIALKKK